jgi:hypothetical protein
LRAWFLFLRGIATKPTAELEADAKKKLMAKSPIPHSVDRA